jgi:hypothetical protein
MGLTCKDGTWVYVKAVRGSATAGTLNAHAPTATLRR